MVIKDVGILVALLAFKARAVGVNILKLAGNGPGFARLDIGKGCVYRHDTGVGFRRGGKQNYRLGKR